MNRFYLGVDGGQSSTTALIANGEGRIIGMGRNGPCNHVGGPERQAKFIAVLGSCLTEAIRTAGLDSSTLKFSAACLGFSGGAEDKTEFCGDLVHTERLRVTHDAEIALIGATGGEPGIIVIAGTGSIAFGRNASGRMARAGGWGYLFGDEGGAFDITRRALRAALQFEEGWGPATSLHHQLLSKTGATDANRLMHLFYAERERHEIAALAPLISEAAEAGDEIAQRILVEAGTALACYAEGVHHNLFSPLESVTVAHVGGVFQSAPVRDAFAANTLRKIRSPVVYPKYCPAAGAVLAAMAMDENQAKLSAIPEIKR